MSEPSKKDIAELEHYLTSYFNGRSEEPAARNLIIWALHDYYMKLLEIACLKYFEMDIELYLKNSSNLGDRWFLINKIVDMTSGDDSQTRVFNGIIWMLREFSGGTRHDVKAPPLNRMDEIYEKAKPFHTWLFEKGKIYADIKKKSKLRDIDLFLSSYSIGLIRDLEILQTELGENPPFIHIIKDIYSTIPQAIANLTNICRKVEESNPLDFSDVLFILDWVENKEKIDGEKWAMIAKNRCPKCGGRITNSEWYSPHPSDEPPDEVHWRIGCEKCDFELDSGSENI